MKKLSIAILFMILLSLIVGIYSYSNLKTDRIASHWDVNGEANDYMSKFWGIFFMPLIIIALYLLLLTVPLIDPLKKNITKFKKDYNWFMFTLILFMFYVYILTILANFNYGFNMSTMLMPALGLWFIYIGKVMNKFKRNWFIGVRTPWTLSSDNVWNKTHKLASKLFSAIGVIMIISIFLPYNYIIWMILMPLFIMLIWVVLYSYLEYKKEKN